MPTTSVSLALDRFATFGDLLRYLRRRTGLTQRELSIAVGYSDTQISRLEQNERMPDLATLTARFLPALHIEDQPEVAARLLELAAAVRREDAPAVGLPPYKGLHHFEEKDADLFFGRQALTARLYDRLTERLESDRRFLAVIGSSGSGKSSLVRAGLMPSLRWHKPSSGLPVILLTPTAHPLEALAAALIRETRQSLPIRKIVDRLERNPGSLLDSLAQITLPAGVTHAVLIIDQFEELFTLCRSHTEQFAFVEGLVHAAFQPEGVGMVIIVMRADFYAHCARFESLRQALAQHQEYIGPMTNQELRQAIEGPARCGHWEFEPGLVDLLLHDVGADAGHAAEPGALPLLSHALLATWQRRRGRTMTLSGYTASGGVRGAIAETAEAVYYDRLEPEQREVARQIFLRMTELGGETSTADTRRRVSLAELVSKPADRELVQDVLLTLADARLITTDQDTAEVAHEALIREWPTLRGWLEEDREGLRMHRRLTEAAQEWQALDRDPEVLYRGARLAQAVEWTQAHVDQVNLLERDFLEASHALLEKENIERETQRQRELEVARRLAETERQRAEAEQRHAAEQARSASHLRQQAVYLALALGAALVLLLAAVWLGQMANSNALAAQEQARLASSRELAAAAVNNLQVDPERSVLLALKALEDADTLEARNALHQAIPELHLLLNIPAHPGGVPDVACSPDGKLIASMGAYGEVKIWDAHTGELTLTLDGETGEPGGNIAFSPDGSSLAGAWVTQVVVWDLRAGKKIYTLSGKSVGTNIGYNLGVGQVSFSPDGKRLAVANLDGLPGVWELASQAEILSLLGEMLPAKAIAYSSDGSLLATGGDEGIVRVWDAGNGAELYTLPLGGIIHSLSFSASGSRLAAASEDGSVKVWEAGTGEEVLNLPRLSGLYDIAFLKDGRFATAGQDGTTRVWDSLSGQQQLTLAGGTSTVISVAGSPDGNWIATGAWDGSLRVWDASPGRELLAIPGHAGIVWNTAYSPDGIHLASASVDGFIKLWNSESGELTRTLPPGSLPMNGFTGLAFSPDGSRLAAGSVDGAVTIWDIQAGKMLASLDGHTNMVTGLAFSPRGERLASTGWDGNTFVWDLTNGDEITSFRGSTYPATITNIAFSPDGRTVFTGVAEDKFIYQWDAASGQERMAFSGEGKEIYGIALSADGELLAAGDQDGRISLWDVESGEKLYTVPGHAGLVLRLVFNPEGSQLASAGFDRLAKIWDVKSGAELFSLYGNTSNVFGASFSPDGESLATAGADGGIRTYTLQLENLIALAKARLTRSLNDEECQKFLHVEQCPLAQDP